ncbi:tRNA pseudouridine(55) synthase TruB [Geoalkalibacter halelectricus]|uniref:tRNA pseudouridine synthase B n=1 Tax=Geoalkalibacter halelectricus TaxID=2847045 RepID=A0ABY5ZRW1_9BACT|nr:tRNA pseudouridine(55) synthase TruB [Geoalkalibacter halelectricus]MDO3376680.1 tRNA pseudouridine(55) synthase TruB [Geoalkalibacter halelectricus]UWZ81368.1 tRNA pseudouridine(55) synthase TruB [Geoalkalibacter halelectricus]
MDGLLLIDKPRGITSHDVVARVRRILRTRRVGHTGTLDPMATGVLPVAVGRATRLVEFLMADSKTYRATLKLGEITDTQDADGQIVERRQVSDITQERVVAACRAFLGDIAQTPPMYSALKKDGVPLYRLARQGIEVERAARRVRIERIDLLSWELPFLEIEVDCSKGTYIRTLAHDLGAFLGPGAHLVQLCRTRSGAFSLEECLDLENLSADACPGATPGFLELSEILRGVSRLAVDEAGAARLAQGIPPTALQVEATPGEDGDLVVLMRGRRLLAVARYAPARLLEKRGDFELLRVFPEAAAA